MSLQDKTPRNLGLHKERFPGGLSPQPRILLAHLTSIHFLSLSLGLITLLPTGEPSLPTALSLPLHSVHLVWALLYSRMQPAESRPVTQAWGGGKGAAGLMGSSLLAQGEPGFCNLSFLIGKNCELPVLLLIDFSSWHFSQGQTFFFPHRTGQTKAKLGKQPFLH